MTTTLPPDEPLLSLPFVAVRALAYPRHLIRQMITTGTITGYRVGPKAIRVK